MKLNEKRPYVSPMEDNDLNTAIQRNKFSEQDIQSMTPSEKLVAQAHNLKLDDSNPKADADKLGLQQRVESGMLTYGDIGVSVNRFRGSPVERVAAHLSAHSLSHSESTIGEHWAASEYKQEKQILDRMPVAQQVVRLRSHIVETRAIAREFNEPIRKRRASALLVEKYEALLKELEASRGVDEDYMEFFQAPTAKQPAQTADGYSAFGRDIRGGQAKLTGSLKSPDPLQRTNVVFMRSPVRQEWQRMPRASQREVWATTAHVQQQYPHMDYSRPVVRQFAQGYDPRTMSPQAQQFYVHCSSPQVVDAISDSRARKTINWAKKNYGKVIAGIIASVVLVGVVESATS